MVVKNKFIFILLVLTNILLLLSILFKKISIGNFWYALNPNSLVGFQGFFERNLSIFFKNRELLLIYFYSFLDLNIFFLSGVFILFIIYIFY